MDLVLRDFCDVCVRQPAETSPRGGCCISARVGLFLFNLSLEEETMSCAAGEISMDAATAAVLLL